MTTDTAVPESDIGARADALAKIHFRVAALFLAIGAAAGLLLAIELSAPGFLNSGPLSYGRLHPVFTGALLFGWLTIGLIGAIYYLLPRLTGAPLHEEPLALLSLVLIAAGTVIGLVAVALGGNQGVPLFEFPFYSDIAIIAGLTGVTRVVTRTAVAHREPHVYVSVWFFVASVWWLLVSYLVGSLAGFRGTDLELVNRFAEAGVLFLWVVPAGLGIAYYIIPKLTDTPLFSMRLAVVSFWSVAGTFAWVGAHTFTFGPGPDWLETITVVFAIAVLVPITAAVANLLLSIDWAAARRSTPVRLALAGTSFFALLGLQILALAFRSSSTIVQFTTWTEATFVITVLGAGSMWLLALLSHLRGGGESVLRLAFPGVAVLVATLWLGGLLTGFTWSAGPASQDFVNYGEGFVNTTAQLAGFDTVRWLAWVLVAAGLVWFAVRTAVGGRWHFSPIGSPSGDAAEPDELGVLPPNKVAAAAVLIIGAAFLTTVLMPVLDASDEEPSLLAVSSRDYEAFAAGTGAPQAADLLAELGLDLRLVAEGRDIYIAEGCVYCHTQQVRANVTDVGLGAVTSRQDVTLTSPALLGRIRLGPDLAHAGRRAPTDDVDWVAGHLANPRLGRAWSAMPSYDYLTDDELDALAQYIVSLQ